MNDSPEYQEVEVQVEREGKPVTLSFRGKLLSRISLTQDGHDVVCRAYRTAKGKIAVTRRTSVSWQESANFSDDQWSHVASSGDWWQPVYELFVADEWSDLVASLGNELVEKLQRSVEPIPVEHLDI